MNNYNLIKKYNPPTRFDKDDYKQLYIHMMDEGNSELFIQLSKDIDKPQWIPILKAYIPLLEEIAKDGDILNTILQILS